MKRQHSIWWWIIIGWWWVPCASLVKLLLSLYKPKQTQNPYQVPATYPQQIPYQNPPTYPQQNNSNSVSKVYQLVGNQDEDTQNTLAYLKNNTPCTFKYNQFERKYEVYCGRFIGYLPKVSEKYIHQNTQIWIHSQSVSTKDYQTRYVVKVTIS